MRRIATLRPLIASPAGAALSKRILVSKRFSRPSRAARHEIAKQCRVDLTGAVGADAFSRARWWHGRGPRGRASVGLWAARLEFLVVEIHQVVALGGSSVRASGVFLVAVTVVFGVGAGCMWERKPLLECPSPDGRWQVTVLREFAGGAAGACQLALELRRAEAGWFERRLVGRWEQGCAYLDEGVRLEWRDDQRLDVGLPDRLAEDLGRGGVRQEDSWDVDVPLGDAATEVEVKFFFWPARPFDPSAPTGFGDPGPNGFAYPAAAGCFRP